MREWDPTSIQEALDMEMTGVVTEGGEVIYKQPHELAGEIINETLPMAMRRIAHIACYSDNETKALSAAMYICDRALGKATDQPMAATGAKDKLAAMVDAAMGGSA
jgi:hypothetical protein